MQITKAMPIKKRAIRFDVSQAFVLVRAMLDKQEILNLNNLKTVFY